MNPIRGHVSIKVGDYLRIQFLRYWWLVPLVFVIVAFDLYRSILQSFSLQDALIGILMYLVTAVVLMLFVFGVLLSMTAIAALLMSKQQRDVIYEFDERGFTIRDAGGAMLSYPWSLIRGAREDRRAFWLKTKRVMGFRYFPKRAFGQEELSALRALLIATLGTSARLKGK